MTGRSTDKGAVRSVYWRIAGALARLRQSRRATARASPRRLGRERLDVEQLEPRLTLSASAAQWYVSPYGSSLGDGSLAHPWDLRTALLDNTSPSAANDAVQPGDTIWLIGGTYQGSFVSYLQGTVDKPIVVRAYNQQRVTIDHPAGIGLTVAGGGNVWFWGLELTSSSTARVSQQTGPWPTDILAGTGASFANPPGVKVINSVIHDGAEGLELWNPGLNAEANGNLIYYAGWNAPDRTHGHGVYTQNSGGTKKLIDNVVFYNASHGLQAYGSGSAFADNYDIEGNTFFDNGDLFAGGNGRNLLVGGGQGVRNETLIGNNLYRNPATFASLSSDFMLGFGGTGMQDSTVRDNYIAGATYLSGPFTNVDVSQNTFYGGTFSEQPARNVPTLYPNNAYPAGRPNGVQTFVRANQYEVGRANVTIYNWDKLNSVNVDISGIGLSPGDSYELHNAENFYGDVLRGTYAGGSITVPMTDHTMAAPVGIATPATTFPEFGVFVVTKADPPPAFAPTAPANLTAQSGDGRATLSWTASPGASSYNVFRSTSSGQESQIATGVSGTMFTNSGLTNGTTYYYQISAVNAAGQSVRTAEVSVKPRTPSNLVLAVDAGGTAAGVFLADSYFTSGATYSAPNAVDTYGLSSPAPQSVYQTMRWGDSSYVLPNLQPRAAYTVELDFAEIYADGPGQRVFNATINGSPALANFDPFVAAGGQFKAVARQFNTTADSAGKIAVQFAAVAGYARVSGIEVFAGNIALAPLDLHVTTTADSGPGSLRQAILDANANPAPAHNIVFDFAAGATILSPLSAWPTIAGAVAFRVGPGASVVLAGPFAFSLQAGAVLTKSGPGTLSISAPQSHAVGAVLNANEGVVNLASDGGPNLTVNADAAVNFIGTQHLAALVIGPNATATLSRPANSSQQVLVVGALGLTATSDLDLKDNSLIVHGGTNPPGTFLAVEAAIRSAFDNFNLDGHGIKSSAILDPFATGLGSALNSLLAATFASMDSLDGQPLALSDTIARYTYLGDATLDGVVNDDDASLVGGFYDNGATAGHHWFEGDFTHDGLINDDEVSIVGGNNGLLARPTLLSPFTAMSPATSSAIGGSLSAPRPSGPLHAQALSPALDALGREGLPWFDPRATQHPSDLWPDVGVDDSPPSSISPDWIWRLGRRGR